MIVAFNDVVRRRVLTLFIAVMGIALAPVCGALEPVTAPEIKAEMTPEITDELPGPATMPAPIGANVQE